MPSAAFEQELMMTFTQDIPYMNSLNLMSTIATQVKVLSTQVHSDRINLIYNSIVFRWKFN
jgi:hypothetical protein